MKYVLELKFTDKPECSSCMLCGTKGLDLYGETVMACYGLGIRPKCPEQGCRRDCPLQELEDKNSLRCHKKGGLINE